MSLLFGPLCTHGNGNGARFATWNPLDSYYALAEGNSFAGPGLDWGITRATAYKDTGKHSFEVEAVGVNVSFSEMMIYGVAKAGAANYYLGSDALGVGLFLYNGTKVYDGGQSAFASFAVEQGDVFTFHYDADTGGLAIAHNGSDLGVMATPFAGQPVAPACSLYSGGAGCRLKNGPVQYPKAGYTPGWIL